MANPTPRSPSGLAPSHPNRRLGPLAVFHLDLPLLSGLLLLCALGLLVLYSASGENLAQLERQLIRLGMAFTAMLLLAQINPADY